MAAGRENTIHSLNSAAKNGADYVEFDVQLTKDKVWLPASIPLNAQHIFVHVVKFVISPVLARDLKETL